MNPASRTELNPWVIYFDGKPRALTMARGEEDARNALRAALLGQSDFHIESVTFQLAWDCPFDDFVRVALAGLYMRIF